MHRDNEKSRTMIGVMANSQSALWSVQVLAEARARVDDSGKIRVAAEKNRTRPALRKKTGL